MAPISWRVPNGCGDCVPPPHAASISRTATLMPTQGTPEFRGHNTDSPIGRSSVLCPRIYCLSLREVARLSNRAGSVRRLPRDREGPRTARSSGQEKRDGTHRRNELERGGGWGRVVRGEVAGKVLDRAYPERACGPVPHLRRGHQAAQTVLRRRG